MKLTLTVEDGVGRIDGYLTSYEYAEKNGLKESNVRRYIYLGKLDGLKVGSGWWVKEDAAVPPKISFMKDDDKKRYLNEMKNKLDKDYYQTLKLLDGREK